MKWGQKKSIAIRVIHLGIQKIQPANLLQPGEEVPPHLWRVFMSVYTDDVSQLCLLHLSIPLRRLFQIQSVHSLGRGQIEHIGHIGLTCENGVIDGQIELSNLSNLSNLLSWAK